MNPVDWQVYYKLWFETSLGEIIQMFKNGTYVKIKKYF